MWRVILGFLACVSALPIYFLWKHGSLNFLVSAVMAAVCVVGAVPLFYYFSKDKVPSCREISSAGGVLGLLCAAPFALMTGPFAVFFAVPFMLIGMALGLLFWVIAIYRNKAIPIRWRPAAAQADQAAD